MILIALSAKMDIILLLMVSAVLALKLIVTVLDVLMYHLVQYVILDIVLLRAVKLALLVILLHRLVHWCALFVPL